MNTTLARWLLRVQEAALGRTTFAILREAQRRERSGTDLAALRTAKLLALLNHARSAIPYWRDRLAGWSPPSGAGSPRELLAGLPVLTRSEVRQHLEAMRWRGAPGKVLVHRSGGTTDDNLTFYWGRERQSWDRAMRSLGFARLGFAPGDRALHLWPVYPASGWRGRLIQALRGARDRLTNDVVFDLRGPGGAIAAERIDAAIALCRRYAPAMLIAYPSWLAALARRVREDRPGLKWPGLRFVVSTGELLFAFQRRRIEEALQVPVYQEYGSQDAGLIAHQDAGGTFRLHAEQIEVEVLRDGRPAPPGEPGEVVITHFHTFTMPFIRYATGDVMRQPVGGVEREGGTVCPAPEGRTSDQLAGADGRAVACRPVIDALAEEAGLDDFSLFQPAVGEVSVLAVEGQAVDWAAAEGVLRRWLGAPLKITRALGRGFVPLTSGKRRYVCSPAALALLAHDRAAGAHLARAWPQRLLR